MHLHKVLGWDTMNALFYQKHWDIIGKDRSSTTLVILNGHIILPNMNHKFVALIPKKLYPVTIRLSPN